MTIAMRIPLLCAVALAAVAADAESVRFPSEDGLMISADLTRAPGGSNAPFVVLFHQAGWSRGEYREIAPRLAALGWGSLAVDQRSGGEVNGVANETAERAAAAGAATDYVAALPDLRAALRFARAHYAHGPLLAWGSSYSAALVLRIAGDAPQLLDGALAFAPGEYFSKAGKPESWIRDAARKIEDPIFVTSARREQPRWQPIFDAIPGDTKVSYLPEGAGQHGSRALWARFPDSAGYWSAVEKFLARFGPGAKNTGR